MRYIAGKFTGLVYGDGLGRIAGGIDDLHLPGLDYKKLEVAVSDFEQCLTGVVALERSMDTAFKLCDASRIERRKRNCAQIAFSHITHCM